MNTPQPGILEPVPSHARYLAFSLRGGHRARQCLHQLAGLVDGREVVAGIGQQLALALGAAIPGLEPFPQYEGTGFALPSTPAALWCWLRGEDPGALVHRSRHLIEALAPTLELASTVDAFVYAGGRDLTGYEDGTENPKGEHALAAALVSGPEDRLEASSYVAVQQWVHDMRTFEAMPLHEQDHSIGRRRSDNQELTDAPPSAHVKRTAQEGFSPPAFVLRRSMPWADSTRAGLMFVAFGASLAAFAAQLRRMSGAEDGIPDALFKFTRPVTGAYFWCPPLRDGRLDLRLLGA
ncbi:MAG: Dyp-type peroxidase [Candidatus Latescibacteria bacterium]|nr:Dyp-type peroxidase [Candidatus Latescibacterota bacterium]